MVEMSPQARAVHDAVLATYADNIPKDDALWALERASTVAALRAAADGVQHHWDGMECVDHLQAIAAELEGATPDPLEPNDLSHLSEEEFLALAPQGYHGV